MKLLSVVGARPQFIKAATVSRLVAQTHDCQELLLHTGQHYDAQMSRVFFDQLELPRPDICLHAGSGSHGVQTGKMLMGIEQVVLDQCPDAILVYGDTNSTLAAALAAAKLNVPVAHVEAGLRSYDRTMPEEVNRCLVDRLATWHFCPTQGAVDNLHREGITDNVSLVGDVMCDAMRYYLRRDVHPQVLQATQLEPHEYALCTLHRAANADCPRRLRHLWNALTLLSREMPVVLPLHPRTRGMVERLRLVAEPHLHVVEPVGYLEMLALERLARLIVTDSGGVQKEAYMQRVPCLTLRDTTEWTETVASGWNRLVGDHSPDLVFHAGELLEATVSLDHQDLYGDGHAAQRILEVLAPCGAGAGGERCAADQAAVEKQVMT